MNLKLSLFVTTFICFGVGAIPFSNYCNYDIELKRYFSEADLELLCQAKQANEILSNPKLSIYKVRDHEHEPLANAENYSYETEANRQGGKKDLDDRLEAFTEELFSYTDGTTIGIDELINEAKNLEKELMLAQVENNANSEEISEKLKFMRTMLDLILRSWPPK